MKRLLKIVMIFLVFAYSYSANSTGYYESDSSPFITYFNPPARSVGASSYAYIGKASATWQIVEPTKLSTAKKSVLSIFVYWCEAAGSPCSGGQEYIPAENIVARGDQCPAATTPSEVIECMLAQVQPGKYNFSVQGLPSSSRYVRPRVCLRMIISDNISGTWTSPMAGSCREGNPSLVWCAMTTPLLEFDFGTMLTSEANNKTLEKDMGIYCNGLTYYKVTSVNESSFLDLNNGMIASMKFDGKELGNMQTSVGSVHTESKHKLSVTLLGSPASTGPFYSATILVIDYP